MMREERARIASYGWVDKKAGIARIPVDRAMDILAQKGLPKVAGAAAHRGRTAEHVHPAGRQARGGRAAGEPAGAPKKARPAAARLEARREAMRTVVPRCRYHPRLSRRPPAARRQDTPGTVVSQVGFDQKLGVRLPLDRRFRDDSGRELSLGELFGQRPVILVPVYYQCPLLCNQTLNALTRSLKPLSLDAGKGFDVVAFSIDPEETAELASKKKAAYMERYGRPGTEAGWHFLTGDQDAIAALTEAIGFRYTYNPQTKLYAHAAGIVIVTPDGRTSRYYYGIDYPARDLQAEIERARGGRIGSPVSGLLLLCYDYDAATGKYTLSILRLTRILGVATVLALGSFLFVMFRRDWVRRRGEPPGDGDPRGAGPIRGCARDGPTLSRAEPRRQTPTPCGISRYSPIRPPRPRGRSTPSPSTSSRSPRSSRADLPLHRHVRGAIPARDEGQPLQPAAVQQDHGGALDRRALLAGNGDVHLGDGPLLPDVRPSARCDGGLRRRQAVDVEDAAFRGPVRDQRAARPAGPGDQADDDLART